MAKTKGEKKSKLKPIIISNGPVIPTGVKGADKKAATAHRIKRVSWHDDGGVQDFADPAILAMGNVPPLVGEPITPEFRYSKDDLLKLRKAPGSLRRPDFLDATYYNNNGVWDPEPWHYGHKANDTAPPPPSVENGAGGAPPRPANEPNNDGHKQRRSGDPRERIRKEQDGIVLSPQRRSFNSGCFVPVREVLRPARAHSPLGGGKGEPVHITHRDITTGPPTRRIGSGRILSWDFQEKSDVDNDFGYRRGGPGGGGGGERDRRDTDRERDRDERFDRRSFSREFDVNKERERDKDRHIGRNNNNNSRYNNRRISNDSREEEPEWLSFGPMSQNDTIELRGFDESEKLGNKKKNAAQKKNKKDQLLVKGKDSLLSSLSEKSEEVGGPKQQQQQQAKRPSPPPQDGGGAKPTATTRSSPSVVAAAAAAEKKETGGGDGPHVSNTSVDDNSFNFEDILKCDTIPGISGLLSNGVESGDAAGSRFSRWFKREKSPPVKKTDAANSRRSSLQDPDHHQIIKNLLGDSFNETSVNIPQPGDAESYFAPISPAATSVLPQQQQQQQQQQQHQGKPMNLIDMLQRSNKLSRQMPQQSHMHNEQPQQLKGLGEVPGKILSLEELEATMMHGMDAPNNKHVNKNEDELNAFKRLLTQASSGMNHHMNNGPLVQKPMSIMEMLSHSQQQDEAARIASQRIPAGGGSLPPAHLNDMNYKLQQVQNQVQQQQKLEMFNKLMNATLAQQQQTRASPLPPDMAMNHRELLQRPEAQAILQGLKRGDITPQHLYQQLANPAMQPRHRDLLVTILKMQVTGQSAAAAAATSPVQPPPPSAAPHHMFQQQLRVSPLPNAMHQRIPSPRELQMHTQSIMQRALIKKKLEEQEENYRKKQAQQRGTSPAKTASPTPLAFTPTAVLRKMTADKDESSKENKGDKMPQGRPLTGMRAPQQPPQQQSQQLTSQQQQQQPPNWNTQFTQQLKQPGRPIVKANNNYQQQPQVQHTQQEQFFQQQRLLQAQQQQRKNQQTFNSNYPNQSQQQFPQLTQQQLRAQHQNVRAQHQHQQQQYGGGQPQQQQQQQQPSWAQQMLQGQGFGDNRQVGRGGLDGDLSPTSNQLARWFSPDLLDRARKGKLPVLPGNAVPQALSLEEVERQTTPVGHN